MLTSTVLLIELFKKKFIQLYYCFGAEAIGEDANNSSG